MPVVKQVCTLFIIFTSFERMLRVCTSRFICIPCSYHCSRPAGLAPTSTSIQPQFLMVRAVCLNLNDLWPK